jgi:tetratricopeptide (TPR) repeat protein
MKTIFTILFLAAALCLQIGCGSKTEANSNANAESNQTNANVNQNTNANTKAESTPLPQYETAEIALAEGNKFFDANENDKAIEAYSQAVKLNPDLGEAFFKLGVAYQIREKVYQTDAVLVEETPTPSPTPKASKNKKEEKTPTTDSEKAFTSAVKALEKVVKKNPKDAAAQFYLGRSLEKLNEDNDSLKALKEAVKLQPENSEYQLELGKIYIKLAQYDLAVMALKKALELDEGNLLAEEQLEKAEAGKKRVDFAKRENERKNDRQEQNQREEIRSSTVVKPKQVSNSSTPIPSGSVGKQGNTAQPK